MIIKYLSSVYFEIMQCLITQLGKKRNAISLEKLLGRCKNLETKKFMKCFFNQQAFFSARTEKMHLICSGMLLVREKRRHTRFSSSCSCSLFLYYCNLGKIGCNHVLVSYFLFCNELQSTYMDRILQAQESSECVCIRPTCGIAMKWTQ